MVLLPDHNIPRTGNVFAINEVGPLRSLSPAMAMPQLKPGFSLHIVMKKMWSQAITQVSTTDAVEHVSVGINNAL